MTINSAAEFLKPQEREYRDIEIDGLGSVRIQKLRKSETISMYVWLRPNGKPSAERESQRDLWWIVNSVVDQDGRTFLTEKDFTNLAESKDSSTLDQLTYEILLFNGLIQEESQPEDKEELLGKSES